MMKVKKQIGVGGIVLDKEEKKYLNQVINSSRLSYGPFSQKFEKLFANEHDSKFGIFCNSGTSALHIALASLKEKYHWNDGDEVIIPATTFIATANIVIHNNMKPVFVDVDRNTYNIDTKLIEGKITTKTKAIIPVHLFGLPCDMDPILKIAKKHHLKIVEDSCETMFAKYKGEKVGSFGEIGCFSTYVAHFLVTGVGGICITKDKELAVIMRSIMNHGRDSIYISIDDDKDKNIHDFKEIIGKRYNFIRIGHSFRATELEAAIGLAQFEKKDFIINRRREIARKYIKGFTDLNNVLQLPFIPTDRDHNFMMFPILLKNEKKQRLVEYLELNNIETRDMLPLINQPVYRKMGINPNDYPVSKMLIDSGFYIGCHQYITNEEINYIIGKFHEYFRKQNEL